MSLLTAVGLDQRSLGGPFQLKPFCNSMTPRQGSTVLCTGLTHVLSRKHSPALNSTSRGWPGLRTPNQQQKGVYPLAAEGETIHLPLRNTFPADRRMSELNVPTSSSKVLALSPFPFSPYSFTASPVGYQQGFEHWFPNSQSATQPDEWNKVLLSKPEGMNLGKGEEWKWFAIKSACKKPQDFRSQVGNQKDNGICTLTELNTLRCHFGGLLWATKHPGKDGEIMEV